MTKFIKYLNEDTEEALQILERDCKPFLDAVKKRDMPFLYSGRKKKFKWFKGEVRKNRTPKDTPVEVHNLVDDAFQMKFGKRLRSNCLFTTLSKYHAYNYGTVYYIFPIGKYEIFWHPKVVDLYETMDSYYNGYLEDNSGKEIIDISKDLTPNDKELFLTYLTKPIADLVKGYTTKIPSKLVKSEIMLDTKEYYAFSSKIFEYKINDLCA
jgi:hypothetical protein